MVENHFRARSVTLRQVRRYGAVSRANRTKIKGMLAEDLFDWEHPAPAPAGPAPRHWSGQRQDESHPDAYGVVAGH
ncbi:hypothetical protein DFAR_440007 [Desulfarculales bacterium]